MSARVQVVIEGQEAEVIEIDTLPLQLSKKTDEYLKIGVSGEARASNASGVLLLAASDNNMQIFDQPTAPGALTQKDGQAGKNIDIFTNSTLNLKARCRLSKIEFLKDRPSALGIEVYGQGASFFGALKNLLLNELPLGTWEYSIANIQATWDATYPDTSAQCAPVVYRGGAADGQSSVFDTYTWDHFRPQVYFAAIVDAIGKATGYRIVSKFFETDFFRSHVYLFGVGTNWQKSTGPFRYQTSRSGPLSPPAGNFSYVSIVQGGGFSLQLQVGARDQYNVQLSVGLRTAIDVRLVFSTGEVFEMPPGVQTADPLFLEDVLIEAGTVIEVQYKRLSAGTSQIEDVDLVIDSVSQPTVGAEVDLASCLHQKPCADYLKGLSHLFNLAWHVEESTKTVTVEPRHHYTLPDGSRREGFYYTWYSALNRSEKEPRVWDEIVDASATTFEFSRPFGNGLILRPKQEDGQLGQRAKSTSGNSRIFMGSKLPMVDCEEAETVSENPFFENLLLVSSSPLAGSFRWMPIVMPDYDGEWTPVEEATYESEPKYAIYAGRIPYLRWDLEDIGTLTVRPVLYQAPPKAIAQTSFSVPYAGCYHNVESGMAEDTKGYVSRFYLPYYSTIRKGLVITANSVLKADQFYGEDFRRLVRFRVNGSECLGILMEIENFEPARIRATKTVLVAYIQPTQEDLARIVHSQGDAVVSISVINIY